MPPEVVQAAADFVSLAMDPNVAEDVLHGAATKVGGYEAGGGLGWARGGLVGLLLQADPETVQYAHPGRLVLSHSMFLCHSFPGAVILPRPSGTWLPHHVPLPPTVTHLRCNPLSEASRHAKKWLLKLRQGRVQSRRQWRPLNSQWSSRHLHLSQQMVGAATVTGQGQDRQWQAVRQSRGRPCCRAWASSVVQWEQSYAGSRQGQTEEIAACTLA